MVRSLNLHSRFLAIPDEDKYDASPFPDFEDDGRVQQYLQDRRVLGVCLSPLFATRPVPSLVAV